MNTASFQFKGSLFSLSILQLRDADLKRFQHDLELKVAGAPKFFYNTPIVIDLSQLESDIKALDLKGVCEILKRYSFLPVGVRGGLKLAELASTAGLAVLGDDKPIRTAKAEPQKKQVTITQPDNLVIEQVVRSGQQIYARDGDLIVIAAVSHGAEILADGNIHIYGSLRGRALAGVNDNSNARIFCDKMEAELVSIAGHYKLSDDIPRHVYGKRCAVRLVNGLLEFELFT